MGRFIRKTKGNYNVSIPNACGNTEDVGVQIPAASSKSCIVWRYIILFFVFMAGFMLNYTRMTVSIALVNMVKFTSTRTTVGNKTLQESCPIVYNLTQDSSKQQMGGEFDWSPQLQSVILGAGFIGYGFIPAIGGSLAQMFGAKRTLLYGNTIAAIAMLVSPIASSWHSYALIAAQFVRGVTQGVFLPCMVLMTANWTPRGERATLGSLIYTGAYAGAMVGGAISGCLCEIKFLGWRSTFYFSGAIGLLYSISFSIIFYETPNDHPWISKEELKYITNDQEDKEKKKKKPPTPWLKIFTSIKTYALLWGMFGQFWALSYFVSVHPLYLGTILHFPILENGLYSSLPFLMLILSAVFSSSISDWLYRREYVSINNLRKGFNFLGCLIFSLATFGMYFAGCDTLANNLFFAIALMSCGISTPGSRLAVVDMTPNFAAALMGVLGLVCNQTGFVVSVVTGYLRKEQTQEGWKTLFLINIAVVMSSGIVFAVFGSANVQQWNFAKDSNDANETSKEERDWKSNGKIVKIDMDSVEIPNTTH